MTMGLPSANALSTNPLSTSSLSSSIPAGVSASEAFSQKSFTDISALQNLKGLGKKDQGKAIEQVAKQFESIFIQQMLKSMRQAGDVLSKGGLFDSHEMKFHRDMLDQQLGLSMTQGKGLGLADSIARQLKRQYGLDKVEGDIKPLRAELAQDKKGIDIHSLEKAPTLHKAKADDKTDASSVIDKLDQAQNNNSEHCTVVDHLDKKAVQVVNKTNDQVSVRNYVEAVPVEEVKADTEVKQPKTPAEFVAQMLPYAKQAAEALGIDYKVLLAQSALESGWGKAKNGNNLFGIKATGSWKGEKKSAETVEYVQGQIQRPVEDFRSYNSHQASFMDYANLIKNASRYDTAVGEQDPKKYIEALHSAGYATDPNYVKKVMSVYHSESMRHAIAHTEHRGVGND